MRCSKLSHLSVLHVVPLLLASLACLAPALAVAQPRVDDSASVKEHATALSKAFRRAAEATSPAVVTIVSKVKAEGLSTDENNPLLRDPRFRQLFPEGRVPERKAPEGSEEENEQSAGIGSGVIIDPSGLVLTNNHVVEGADSVLVRLNDGREFTAEDIRTDPMSDIAVLRIKDTAKFPAAKMGDSKKLEIGDWVIAIGSPFELEATVSAGIISGKGRSIQQIRRGSLIQTDAAINPGNSGGPLVNLDGEVIGINTAIATVSGGYQGIGFAIPIDRAKWVAQELVQHNQVRRAYLGIRIDEATAAVAKQYAIPVQSGVVVVDVVPNSPAGEAGLAANDVITEFAGVRVRNPRDLQDVVEQQPFGSKPKVKVLRGGKAEVVVQVAVKPLPENFDRSFPAKKK